MKPFFVSAGSYIVEKISAAPKALRHTRKPLVGHLIAVEALLVCTFMYLEDKISAFKSGAAPKLAIGNFAAARDFFAEVYGELAARARTSAT